ncbi:MAG TPA: CRISPR-associated protein Cas6, partial [Oscillatoriales bacterium UBA8482]|nr:CRISPR-associated protein Cas6 [Oscillatoriales bacterium UBA8482]
MLIRSTWILTPNETTILPRAYGLELVKQLHEQLGLEMGKEAIPSVSFAGLTGRCLASEGFLTFNLGEFYQLSLCGLEERAG